MSDKQRKTERITFRITAVEASRLRDLAKAKGLSPSSLVRDCLKRILSRAA